MAACAVLAVVAALLWPREREPEYKGRKLSAWIRGASRNLDKAGRDERIEAMHHIGTNALPHLLEWIEDGGLVKLGKVDAAVMKVTSRAMGRNWIEYRSRKVNRAIDALWAFDVLGPQASPAIPELIRLSHGTNRWVSQFASVALNIVDAQGTVWRGATGSLGGGAPAVPGKWAVGHVWKTNSKVQVPPEVEATNSGVSP